MSPSTRQRIERDSLGERELPADVYYSRAAEIAKRAIAKGKTIRETIEEEGLLTNEELAEVMDTRAMTEHEQ